MKLSTRGRYGTRALLDLALHSGQGFVTMKDIAQRQDISAAYLARLLTPLVGAGIVRSTRGPQGGVSLSKPPNEIKLSEVIKLLEGSIAPVGCVDDERVCPRSNVCVTREVWDQMSRAMIRVLESTTLQDLVDRQREKERQRAGMYYI